MNSNWGKAIQYTFATVGLIVVGVFLSIWFNSIWPVVVAIVLPSVHAGWIIFSNLWHQVRIENKMRKNHEIPQV